MGVCSVVASVPSKGLSSLLVLPCSSVCFSASRLFSRMVMAWEMGFSGVV